MKCYFTCVLILSSLICYPQLRSVIDLASLKNLTLSELHSKLTEKKFKLASVSEFERLKEINAEIEIWNHFDADNNQTSKYYSFCWETSYSIIYNLGYSIF